MLNKIKILAKEKLSSGFILELLFLTLLGGIFLFINGRDLNHWYYSAIGDEYDFYFFAKDFSVSGIKIFSQNGVFGYHPVLGSLYQSLVMRIFGENNFGWRISSVLIVLLTLPAFFYLVKNLFGRKVAIFSSIIFSSSFYFFGYAHLGYNNIQTILPFAYALWLGTEAIKKKRIILFFFSGLFSGLGWYTFYTSRITILVVLFLLIIRAIFGREIRKIVLSSLICLALGFALMVCPLFVNNGLEVFSRMKYQSFFNPETWGIYVREPLFNHWFGTFVVNLTSFFRGEKAKHFLIAPLVDPLTRVFIFVGFLQIIKKIRNPSALFLVLTYLLSAMVVAFNPVKEIVITRLQISIMILAIIGGMGWDFMNQWIEKKLKRFWRLFSIGVGIFLLIINIRIFFYDIPSRYTVTRDALYFKVAQESLIPVIFFEGRFRNNALRDVIRAYSLDQKVYFANLNENLVIPKPFLILNVEKEDITNRDVLYQNALKNLLLGCDGLEKIFIKDFTPQNQIEAIKCS